MTDKKLTDEDVVEGLERCISTTNAKACAGCPFNKQNLCDKDQWALERYALDLIKRQRVEIERLKKRISGQKHALFEQQAYTAELQNEIVKLKDYNENLLAANTGLSNEILEVKSEAYKEFAERIRECCTSNDDLPTDVWLSVTTDICCVLKEMVGEEE